MAIMTKNNGMQYYVATSEKEYNDAITYYVENYSEADDSACKDYEDEGTLYGMKAHYFYKGYRQAAVVVLTPEDYKPEGTLKDQILALCKRHGVEFDRIRYYKQSPYQKARYTAKYVGEEVWLKVDGFNYCFNSVDHCDPLGRIDGFFQSTLGDYFKAA